MINLKLYKNKNLVFSKDGKQEKEILIFDNIIYDPINYILIKEDNNFKYELNFKKNTSLITIKENDYSLNLKMNVTNMEIKDNIHKIYYNIESENLIQNDIIITFK